MTLKLKEKKKVDLKVSIYLIKKKLKKQLNILMIRWMNMLKNFIQIKSKKTMTYHYSHCLFESVRNLVSLEAHASLDKTSICRNLLLILGIFCCRIFLLLLV